MTTIFSEALNSQPRTHAASRKIFLLLGVLVVLTVAAALWIYQQARRSTDDAYLEAHVVQLAPRVSGPVLRVLVEENQSVKKGQLLLEIDPADYRVRVLQAEAALQSALRRLEAARVRAGVARVTTGASLEGARSSWEMSRSNVERARIQVETAARASDSSRARIAMARAQLDSARVGYEEIRSQARAYGVEVVKTRQDLERARKLVALEASPRESLDHAQAAYDASLAQAEAAGEKVRAAQSRIAEASAALGGAEQVYSQSQSQVSEAQAHVAEAQAQSHDFASKVDSASAAPQQVQAALLEVEVGKAEVASARAGLERARLDLEYTRIVAPMDGRVSRRLAEPGSYAQVGQNLMAEVSHDLWVVANFRETELARMKTGQPAQVVIDAYPNRTWPAHVDSLQPGSGSRFAVLPPENASGNWVKVVQRVPVKLRFDGMPEGNLAPGMSVRVRL
ncbi:MAG: biotin/lipoyl-binding protein [Candidatus Eremiobacteraeota bacterium]|nr:biotin/lipoyl-binding protein [Candidatus Eremiobacteraeota bacterium]